MYCIGISFTTQKKFEQKERLQNKIFFAAAAVFAFIQVFSVTVKTRRGRSHYLIIQMKK